MSETQSNFIVSESCFGAKLSPQIMNEKMILPNNTLEASPHLQQFHNKINNEKTELLQLQEQNQF